MTPQRIIEAGTSARHNHEGRSRIEEIQICADGYAEPGYSDPASGIIALGNWNTISTWGEKTRRFETLDDTPARVANLLDKLGVELEWGDEWAVCDDCGQVIRTKPDSYRWKGSFWQDDDGGIHCHECVSENPSAYLEHLEGKTSNAVTLDLDLADHGYVLVEDEFEHGFYHGQDADPEVIGKALRDQGIERFIFTIDSVGQFDIHFSVWVHQADYPKLDQQQFEQANKNGPSPSAGLRRALDDASRKMNQLPDIAGHPKVAKCDTTSGTAKVRLVTPQEFVEGKALKF